MANVCGLWAATRRHKQKRLSQEPVEGAQSCSDLHFWLLAPKTENEYTSIGLSNSAYSSVTAALGHQHHWQVRVNANRANTYYLPGTGNQLLDSLCRNCECPQVLSAQSVKS